MDQDTFFQAIVFGGIYGVSFFIVYLFARKTSPTSAWQFTVGSWIGLMAFVLMGSAPASCVFFVVLFFSSFLIFRKTVPNNLQAFFTDNNIYKATTIPEPVSKLLGSQYYSCAEGTLTNPSGETIKFNWWQGMTSSMIKSGNAYVNSYTYYLAISFAPNTITETFRQAARAKMDTSGFTFRQRFKHWFVLDTTTPIRLAEVEDGSFVIIWQTYHDVERFSHYIDWLKANLFDTKTIETVEKISEKPIDQENRLTQKTETVITSVIPSSRHQHEQAVGQAPKVSTHSHR
ncbi:hypothetical protein GO755_23860 [Spirosoma sp. HMF4905]|uniref:Uncharacterized protein n=1 Tax=Spirosoma arboris TaxID=2682092 RepID=A0A7K1SHA1_9BACT|nr:hypothetical protein [Spirosoma arboris]MVM33098.1 hypothetical protein [Spirosoma arboris]